MESIPATHTNIRGAKSIRNRKLFVLTSLTLSTKFRDMGAAVVLCITKYFGSTLMLRVSSASVKSSHLQME